MSGQRIAVIGNSGGGKSTLARKLARHYGLAMTELYTLTWQPDWKRKPTEEYDAIHTELIAGDAWILEGLGDHRTMGDRANRATWVIFIDLPLWQHFWLATERHITWRAGNLEHPPAENPTPPTLELFFRNIWAIDQNWMGNIRKFVDKLEKQGKRTTRINSVDELTAFSESIGALKKC
ncbi:MAG: adenylate kinase [Rhodospirillaceae bacterium]|jgi:adenylate kinase family enzyme|nr:adenylate kinase [Rhodospirillaceae bacterium]MBT6205126.1 adenylate kinase [Rhodospirillaceae bacterium]MBT6512391.1 adenylate kinase [Rhodospirillaceae bacterium]MBT7614659.1 adenylate kinase [Rhodospirillaceae bacterium]MBT7646542.1 adenylate kinase [Rhodospirillaceae bacterium]